MSEEFSPKKSYHIEESPVVDWFDLLFRLLHSWKTIIVFTLSCTMLGVGISLMLPRKYTVTVSLAPESQSNTSGQMGNIAGLLGMSAGFSSSSDALDVSLFPEISQSTPFIVGLFNVMVVPYVTDEGILAEKGTPLPVKLYDYLVKVGDKEKVENNKYYMHALKEYADGDTVIQRLSPEQKGIVEKLKSSINVETVRGSSLVEISVTMDDPQIATLLADTVCSRLQSYVTAYRTKKQEEDLLYYTKLSDEAKARMIKAQTEYALSVDYDRSVILQSISSAKERLQQEANLASQLYSQMEQQRELAKAKLQEVRPVYTVVEPAIFPLRPSGTGRKMVVLGFFAVGFFLSTAWALFVKELYYLLKKQIYDRLKEQTPENGSVLIKKEEKE